MKKVKLLILPLVIFIFVLAIALIINNNHIKVESYDALIYIDEFGNMEVNETWIIKYPSGYHVRFRDIPYSKDHRHNPLTKDLEYHNDKSSFEKNNVSVEIIDLDEGITLVQGSDYRVGYSFNNDRDELGYLVECDGYYDDCESIFVDLSDYGMKGRKSFTYNYTINGAITSYDDISELNWVLFSYAEAKVKNARVEVHLPSNTYTSDDILAWGHGTSNGYISILDNQNVLITAKNIKMEDELEIRVLFPSDLVGMLNESHKISGLKKANIVSYEENLAEETNKTYRIGILINICTGIIVVVVVLMGVYAYFKFDKEYKASFDKEYLREPPSDITPADLGYLMRFGRTTDEDITATILALIYDKVLILKDKGYEITSKDPDFDIVLNEEANLENLTEHERIVVKFFINTIGDGTKVNTKEIDRFGKKESEAEKLMDMSLKFTQAVKKEYSSKKYFENTGEKLKGRFGLFIALVIISGFILYMLGDSRGLDAISNVFIIGAAIMAFLLYLKMIKKRTKEANEEYAKWRAFKKFLEEFGNFKDYPMPGIVIWEKYLIYATTLGISDKVMEQLRVKLTSNNFEYEDSEVTFMRGYYMGRTSSFYFYNTVSRSFTQAKSRSISTIAAATRSSAGGGGHGGGFSGGSSFGGGGGGGRSR